jgi:hypothetical protein
MQLVHILPSAVMKEMGKVKVREKRFVSATHEFGLYRNIYINEQRMCFEIVFLSFSPAAQPRS